MPSTEIATGNWQPATAISNYKIQCNLIIGLGEEEEEEEE